MSFVHELRVRYGECDPQGIVFNANWLLYFDVAYTEFWRHAVGAWQEVVESGLDAVVAEANVRYVAPARFDDIIQIAVGIERLGETSSTARFDARRGAELLVTGTLRHVFVDRESWGKTEIPAWVRERLQNQRLSER